MLGGGKEKLITVEANCGFLAKHIEPAHLSLQAAPSVHHSDMWMLG